MSMTLFVFLEADRCPTGAAWQNALNELNIPLQFTFELNPAQASGGVPLHLRGGASMFQFFNEGDSYAELRADYPELADLRMQSPVVYSLLYGGFLEAAAVFYAALALVARFGGVAFEPSGFVTAEELLNRGKICEAAASDE